METFSALLAICAGNSPGHAQKPVTRSFDVFFDLCLNKRLSKHSWGWWFETLSGPLWHHCYVMLVNTQKPEQNSWHFEDDTFKCIFLNEKLNLWTKRNWNVLEFITGENKSALLYCHETSHYMSHCCAIVCQWATMPCETNQLYATICGDG